MDFNFTKTLSDTYPIKFIPLLFYCMKLNYYEHYNVYTKYIASISLLLGIPLIILIRFFGVDSELFTTYFTFCIISFYHLFKINNQRGSILNTYIGRYIMVIFVFKNFEEECGICLNEKRKIIKNNGNRKVLSSCHKCIFYTCKTCFIGINNDIKSGMLHCPGCREILYKEYYISIQQ